MKTYTIEQIKKYLLTQDSLGDVHYNLNKIDEFLVNKDVIEITDAGDLNDFLVYIENEQGNTFRYEDQEYKISDDVTDFIRDYGHDTFSQIRTNLKELLANGLIEEV